MPKKIEVKKWDKYSRLTIIKEEKEIIHYYNNNVRKVRMFLCVCECWKKITAWLNNLRKFHTKSCWCYAKEKKIEKFSKHWMRNTRIYWIWTNINTRCCNPNNTWYKNYWWRWIKCEWKNFEDFYKDMKDWYKEYLTIDRTDNNWNYCKDNCRWATEKEQARNRRSNILYKWKTLMHWSEVNKINYSTIHSRIKSWWSIEKSIFTPSRKINIK